MLSKDTFNKGGMVLFVLSMIVTLGFFCYVLVINPGPIDTGLFTVPVKFSKGESDQRATSWKEMTEENVKYGHQLYSVNCASCHSQNNQDVVKELYISGQPKRGRKPLEIYSAIRNGWDGQHHFDYVPEREKWAIIAFLRSQMKDAPDDSKSEWNNYLQKGRY